MGKLRPTVLGLLLSGAAPAIAAAPAPPPLEAYGDLPDIEDMAISPSGKGLAILGRMEGERRLIVVTGKTVRVNAPVGDAKLRSIGWIGDERVMLITSATQNLGPEFTASKHEFDGAVIVPLDGKPTYQVFGGNRSMANAIWGSYGARLIDGKWRGVFGGVEFRLSGDRIHYEFDHGRPALFSVDLQTNTARRIARAPSEAHWRDYLIDAQGQVTATLDVASANGRWELTNARGLTLATGVDPEGDVDLVSLGRTGTSVIYSREDPEEKIFRWFEVPLTGGMETEILPDIRIERIYTDPATGRLLGYLPEGTVPAPVMFDPAHQEVLRKVYRAFPKNKVAVRGWTPSFSHILVTTSGNGDSGTWFLVDLAQRKADPVGYERVAIAPEQVGPISTFAYKASDGLQLDGILTLPPGREAKNLPVIMLPHGGPHAHDEPVFDWWAQAFASRGYAVFQPNFRGSTNRDTAFTRAGYGQWGRKMQTDISDGLAELARQGIVDPKRACIVGASYGGYAALAGVTLQNGLYRCAVAVAPVSDLTDRYNTKNRESGSNQMVRRSMRESLGDPKTFAQVSPRRSAAKADAPILLIHGKDDTVVSFSQSTAMADALKDAGRPYEMVVLREEDHWLSRAATRKQMLEATMGFVQRLNPAN